MLLRFLGSHYPVRSIAFIDVDAVAVVYLGDTGDRLVTMTLKEFNDQIIPDGATIAGGRGYTIAELIAAKYLAMRNV